MTGEEASLSFDRAAAYYDRTRALTPAARRKVVELIGDELAGRGRCLELGVGTGRIALPLEAAGYPMTGIDVSWSMLSQLMANVGGRAPFPLVLADATTLPFAAGSFGAALACHVLHLISDWRDVLAEVVRAVEPGGVFLNDLGGWTDSSGAWRQIQERFAAEAGFELRHRGAHDPAEVDEAMAALGASARRLPVILDSKESTVAEQMCGLAEGLWSFTWQVPEETRRAVAEKVSEWACARFGGPATTIDGGTEIAWTVYELC